MLRHFYASITILVNRDSKEIVGDEILSPYFKYIFCLIPLEHDIPPTPPYEYNFIKFMASTA